MDTTQSTSLIDLIACRKTALTAKQLAEYLGLADTTIFQWAKSGRIPFYKFGSAIRFDPKAIAAWLQEHYVTT